MLNWFYAHEEVDTILLKFKHPSFRMPKHAPMSRTRPLDLRSLGMVSALDSGSRGPSLQHRGVIES